MSHLSLSSDIATREFREDVRERTVRRVLPLVVLLGAFLRFHGLSSQSLWVDDMLTLQAANIGGSLGVSDIFSNIQGPLHAVLIHLIARFSVSEIALRGVSALAGVATIPVVYLLGREMSDRRTGLVAAVLAAVSPFAIWYSQEVRNYALLIFFASVSTLAAWRIVTAGARSWTLYVVSIALALYSNLSGAFLWLAHTVFGLGRLVKGRRLGSWVGACLVVALLLVPLFLGLLRWFEVDEVSDRVVLVTRAEEDELLRGSTTASPMAVPYSIYTMVYGYSLGPGTRELHVVSPLAALVRHIWLVLPAGLLAAVLLALGFRKLWKRGAPGRLVASIVFVPFLVAMALAFVNVKPFNVRYVAVMLPVVLIALAAGVTAAPRRVGTWLCTALVLFSLLSVARYRFDPEYMREDIRGVAAYVEENEQPGDIVLVPVVRNVFRFYFEGEAEYFALFSGQTRSHEIVRGILAERTSGHGRLWFVDSRLWRMDPAGRVPAVLTEDLESLETREFAGATLTLYALSGEDFPVASEDPGAGGGR